MQLIKLFWKVVHWRKKGREIGFPTANMELLDSSVLIPQHWVYAAQVIVDNKTYISLANIWCAKTFWIEIPTIEPHIIDFEGDLYWEIIELILHKRLRWMMKFPSEQALINQLQNDKIEIINYFKNIN